MTAAPTGTLIRKTHRQLRWSVSSPPTSPPVAPPAVPTAVHSAIARVRAAPSGNVAVTSDNVTGARTAAPTPCTARAAISTPPLCATPAARLAAVNSPSPSRNTRLRPKRSAARPPSSRNPANVTT